MVVIFFLRFYELATRTCWNSKAGVSCLYMFEDSSKAVLLREVTSGGFINASFSFDSRLA